MLTDPAPSLVRNEGQLSADWTSAAGSGLLEDRPVHARHTPEHFGKKETDRAIRMFVVSVLCLEIQGVEFGT